MSIQEHLNKIRNAIKGSEVRESIAKGIETAYNDASEKDNANMEVKMARGTHPNLRSRLDETTAQLAQKANKSSLDVERKRIDSFTKLPEGSTSGDAELIDARVGSDGRIYENAGDALRGQVNSINESLINNYLQFPYNNFEAGTINNTGLNIPTNDRVRTSIFSFNYPVNIKIDSGYEISVALYNNDAFDELLYWYDDSYTVEPNQQFRLVIRKTGDSPIEVSEAVSSLKYSSKMLHDVKVNSQLVDKLNHEMSNDISIRKRLSNSNNILNNLMYDISNGEYKRSFKYAGNNPDWSVDTNEYYTVELGYSDYILHFGNMESFNPAVSWLTITRIDGTSFIYSLKEQLPLIGEVYRFGQGQLLRGYIEGLEDGSYLLHIPADWDEIFSSVSITLLTENVKNGTAYIETLDKVIPKWLDVDGIAIQDPTNSVSPIADDIEFEIGSISNSTGENVTNTARARSVSYIPFNKGDKVISISGYMMIIIVYDEQKNFISSTYPGAFLNEWTAPQKCFVKVVVSNKDFNKDIQSVEDVSNNILFKNTSDFDQYHAMKTRSNDGWYYLKDSIEQLAKRYVSQNVGVSLEEAKYQLLNGNNYLVRGKITKSGRHLLDQFGEPIILRGIGTHQLNDFQELRTDKALETLKYYGVNSIRVSAYLSDAHFMESDKPTHGYINHTEEIRPIIEDLIERATEIGLYVILDWHSYHTIDDDVTKYSTEQEVFFEHFSSKYASYDNIIYEFHNEPYKNSMLELLPTIQSCASIVRANNPDAVLMTGISGSAVNAHNLINVENGLDVFISVHYYLGAQDSNVTELVNAGVHLFVSEWGNSGLSGTGVPNYDKARDFIDECELMGVSHNCWKLTHQEMDTAVVVNNPVYVRFLYPSGGYTRGDLTENGKVYFSKFKEYGIESLID